METKRERKSFNEPQTKKVKQKRIFSKEDTLKYLCENNYLKDIKKTLKENDDINIFYQECIFFYYAIYNDSYEALEALFNYFEKHKNQIKSDQYIKDLEIAYARLEDTKEISQEIKDLLNKYIKQNTEESSEVAKNSDIEEITIIYAKEISENLFKEIKLKSSNLLKELIKRKIENDITEFLKIIENSDHFRTLAIKEKPKEKAEILKDKLDRKEYKIDTDLSSALIDLLEEIENFYKNDLVKLISSNHEEETVNAPLSDFNDLGSVYSEYSETKSYQKPKNILIPAILKGKKEDIENILMEATREGRLQDLLSERNKYDESPAMYAIKRGYHKIAKTLIKLDRDITNLLHEVRDRTGEDLKKYAKVKGQEDIVNIIDQRVNSLKQIEQEKKQLDQIEDLTSSMLVSKIEEENDFDYIEKLLGDNLID